MWIADVDSLKVESKTPGIGLAMGQSPLGGVCIRTEIGHSIVSGDFIELFSDLCFQSAITYCKLTIKTLD